MKALTSKGSVLETIAFRSEDPSGRKVEQCICLLFPVHDQLISSVNIYSFVHLVVSLYTICLSAI